MRHADHGGDGAGEVSLSLRSFEAGDEAGVIELWRVCGLVVPHNDPHKDIARKLANDPERFLIGEVEGHIVASCMVGYDGHRGSIYYLAVHPEHQRRGCAERLMTEAERLLLEAGCPKVNLLVRNTNQAVTSFYEKTGYCDNGCLSLGKRLIPD